MDTILKHFLTTVDFRLNVVDRSVSLTYGIGQISLRLTKDNKIKVDTKLILNRPVK